MSYHAIPLWILTCAFDNRFLSLVNVSSLYPRSIVRFIIRRRSAKETHFDAISRIRYSSQAASRYNDANSMVICLDRSCAASVIYCKVKVIAKRYRKIAVFKGDFRELSFLSPRSSRDNCERASFLTGFRVCCVNFRNDSAVNG